MKSYVIIAFCVLGCAIFAACGSSQELNPFDLLEGLTQSDFKHGWGRDSTRVLSVEANDSSKLNKNLLKWKHE